MVHMFSLVVRDRDMVPAVLIPFPMDDIPTALPWAYVMPKGCDGFIERVWFGPIRLVIGGRAVGSRKVFRYRANALEDKPGRHICTFENESTSMMFAPACFQRAFG